VLARELKETYFIEKPTGFSGERGFEWKISMFEGPNQ